MKMGSALMFVAILVNPLPGGGKIPAIGQAQMFHLSPADVLLIVLAVSLIQVALFTLGAATVARLAAWTSRRTKRRPKSGRRVPNVTHPVLRYIVVSLLPLAPAGGGLYWSIAFARIWHLDQRITVPLIALTNALAFTYLYLLAGTFGLLAFLIGFVALIAFTYSVKKTASWLSDRRLVPDPA